MLHAARRTCSFLQVYGGKSERPNIKSLEVRHSGDGWVTMELMA